MTTTVVIPILIKPNTSIGKTVFSVGIYEMSNPEKVSLNSMTVTLVFIDNNSFQMHGFMKTWHLIYPGSDITLAPGLISS